MPKMTVTFEWDVEMGERWFNMGNLFHLLYSKAWTKPEFLAVKHIQTLDDDGNELIDVDAECQHEWNYGDGFLTHCNKCGLTKGYGQ